MRLRAWVFALVAPIGLVACVPLLSEENRPCPCAPGWTCCAAEAICVAPGLSCGPGAVTSASSTAASVTTSAS